MSAVETGQMPAAETGQISVVEKREMYSIKTGQRPVAIVDICPVSTADICPASTADVLRVNENDFDPFFIQAVTTMFKMEFIRRSPTEPDGMVAETLKRNPTNHA